MVLNDLVEKLNALLGTDLPPQYGAERAGDTPTAHQKLEKDQGEYGDYDHRRTRADPLEQTAPIV